MSERDLSGIGASLRTCETGFSAGLPDTAFSRMLSLANAQLSTERPRTVQHVARRRERFGTDQMSVRPSTAQSLLLAHPGLQS
jgi:hypothetical protein